MSFPFPEIERRIYPWTFLKDVRVRFYFEPVPEFDRKALDELLERNFGVEATSDLDFNIDHGIKIESREEDLCFNFEWDVFELKVRFPLYKSFDNIIQWIPLIKDYFKVRRINRFTSLAVGKFNELPYSLGENERLTVADAMREIFSGNLLDDEFDEESRGFGQLKRWEKKKHYINADSSLRTDFVFGFSGKNENSSKGVLTLLTIVSTAGVDVSLIDITECLSNMNIVADRAFHWSVTRSIIDKMEGNNE